MSDEMVEADIAAACAVIKGERWEPGAIEAIRRLIENGCGLELMTHFMASTVPDSEARYGLLDQAMWSLQVLAETDKSLACVLMCYLWDKCGMAHDVSDGIDLWVVDCDSPELRQHLKALSEIHPHPGVRRHFRDLLSDFEADK